MMKSAWKLAISMWAAALPGLGCGGSKSCEELCEAREACPDVIAGETSCADQCVAQEKLIKAAVCEDSQAAFDECVSKLADECSAAIDCSTKANLNNACINDYCNEHPEGCADK